MVKRFHELAKEIVQNGGTVSFEWPKNCDGWNLPCVLEMEADLGMQRVDFHGCQVGVQSSKGIPIKKPWRFSTTSNRLRDVFQQFQCPGEIHDECAGKETRKTGFYPKLMAASILESLFDKPESNVPHVTSSVSPLPPTAPSKSIKSLKNARREIVLQQLENQVLKAINKAEAKLGENNVDDH